MLFAQQTDSLTTDQGIYYENNTITLDTVSKGRRELKSKRTYQSKTFLNEDGSYTLELSAGFMHYIDEKGEFREINRSFVPTPDSAYGYEVTHGLYNAYFKSDISQPMSALFETKNRLRLHSQLWGVGYFDIGTKEYKILQQIQSSLAEVTGNEVLYRNVFTDVDVKYMYTDTKLKEEIYISQAARNHLPNPARYNMNLSSTYLVFITKLDFNRNNLRYFSQNIDVTDVDYEGMDRIDFKDVRGAVKFFFPLDIAFLESERYVMDRESEINIKKRIIRVNGERYLLAGVPLEWIRNLDEGTIVFDPGIGMQPDGAEGMDAFVYKSYKPGYEYTTANTNYGTSAAFYIAAGTQSGYNKFYRGYIQFDLSALPEQANVTSARLNAYWADLGSQHGDGMESRYSISQTYIRRVTSGWSESTITWNNQPSSTTTHQVSVSAPGSATWDFSDYYGSFNAIDITTLINDIRSSGNNYGFYWVLQTEVKYRSIYLASSDHTNPGKRPKLEIDYTNLMTKHYYLKDHLGSVRVTIDQTGSVKSYDDYYPFGLQKPGRSYNVANFSNIYKFTEKELDDEANLDWYYFGARYYDPKICRWLSVDPLGEYPSPYCYVGNNPISYLDIDGKSSIVFDGFTNQIYFYDGSGKVLFVFDTHNESVGQGKWENGLYEVHPDTRTQTKMHGDEEETKGPSAGQLKDSKDGRFGEFGIILAQDFLQTDGLFRTVMGIHAGRAYLPFFERVTEGCLRTRYDMSILLMSMIMRNDPLTHIRVINNKGRMGTVTLEPIEFIGYWDETNYTWRDETGKPILGHAALHD